MRVSAGLVLIAIVCALCSCGDSHNVTIRNECQETVNVQLQPMNGEAVTIDGIGPGEERGGTVGLGPMDVKAVFPKSKAETTTGFKSESGGEYRLIIRGDPPGIFLERE